MINSTDAGLGKPHSLVVSPANTLMKESPVALESDDFRTVALAWLNE
jgi:hypothetical protein